MTADMVLTLAVLAFAIVLFVFEWVRVDVVGIIMMVLLPLMGLVTPQQAFSGLSSNAVVSIIAVIIIGAGLDKTGVMNKVATPIIKLGGKSERRVMALVAGTVGVISSMMQNIGAAALFLPATQRVAKRLGIPVSRLLMPMGFCAIIGGTLTLVGASPTILLNDLLVLEGKKLEPFGLFTQTPIGVCLLSSALLYFALFGKYVLPASSGEADVGITARLLEVYSVFEQPYEVEVPDDFPGPKTLEELDIRRNYLVTVVAVGNPKTKKMRRVVQKGESISPGDVLVVMGKRERVEKLAEDMGWRLKPSLDFFADEFARTNSGVVETVVSPRSELVGKTLEEAKFQNRFRVNPLAINTGDRIYVTGINHVRLKTGDVILLEGPWERFHRIRNMPQPRILTFATPLEGEILRPEKAKYAIFWLALALSLVIFTKIRLSVALMTGALGMIITGVLSIDEAYQSVDWMTVFLLGGLIPLGIAFEQTGTAAYIARKVMDMVGQVPPIGLLTVVAVMTSFFTLVISNVGATVLLVPLCMNMAVMAGADPRMAALVVGISASNTFVLPTHQVNALIMRPGGYRTIDYAKAGGIMTLIFLVVELSIIYFFYGVS
ncbi:SLC13 family permease [Thermodesulforhabdus norvegica]|uniref:TrkA-C domain-containing protein n=1 Tax=Thermodesulforhabdus norvegica TaxID=39841 RepID=A0A1I4SL44_9BACT|nr:SLC13 family permease [Thermodesulforhabdus norvegica]SFM65137.1 TrkA-C domain-containing protein [Thermodesulforhabdus norvegica]